MRVLLPVSLCILVVCGRADSQNYQSNFVSGERQEGDYIIANRTVYKPPLPWKPMVATIGITTLSESEILTCVTVASLGGNEFQVQVKNTTARNLVVRVEGKLGEGLYLSVEGYAKYIPTTLAPSTTEENDNASENNEEDSDNENDSESNAGNEEGDDTADGDANSVEGDDG